MKGEGYGPSHPDLIERGMTFQMYVEMSKEERRDWFHAHAQKRQDYTNSPAAPGEKDNQ